jgi:hypothetical protein
LSLVFDDGTVVVRKWSRNEEPMSRRSALAALQTMPEPEEQLIERVTDRFERRMAEECGKVRVEMAHGFGTLRAEMIERNAELLKWGLVYAITQAGVVAALFAVFR